MFLARVAEQAERYEDMVKYLKSGIELKPDNEDFTLDERNLLSVCFKNVIGTQRSALRIIKTIRENEKFEKYDELLQIYKQKIEGELYEKCIKVVNIVKNKCLPLTSDDESKAFFHRMIGDYYRYVSESDRHAKSDEVKSGALGAYQQAEKHSKTLNACNPIRLGMALSYSVYQCEVMNNRKAAIELGELAIAEALEKINEAGESQDDAITIIELLR